MLFRGNGRTKRTTIELVNEFQGKKVFVTKHRVGKRVIKRIHFLLNREPQIYFESNVQDDLQFMKLTNSNRLVGLFKDGEIERPQEKEKLYFLDKLDLIQAPPEAQDSPISLEDSIPDDDTASTLSPITPSTTSSGSTNG